MAQLFDQSVLLGLKAVKLLSQLQVEIPLVLEIVLEVSVDHILQTGHLLEFALQLFSEVLLLSQALCNLTLLMGRSLQLRKHHIEALHQANLFGLQLLELVRQIGMKVTDLAPHAKSVLLSLLPRGQRRVDGIVRVASIP